MLAISSRNLNFYYTMFVRTYFSIDAAIGGRGGQYPVVGGGHEMAVMVGAAAVRQRVVVGEDAPGPTAPRSHPVSRRRSSTTAAATATRVVAHARARPSRRWEDGGLCDAVGVTVGEVAVEQRLRLHGHRDGGEGGAAAVRTAAALAADVEGVLEAPPHVVLLAAVDHKAEEEHQT